MQERTERTNEPSPFDKAARLVTTIACTLISSFTAWIAYSAYQTTISVAELKRDMIYMAADIRRVEKRVDDMRGRPQ